MVVNGRNIGSCKADNDDSMCHMVPRTVSFKTRANLLCGKGINLRKKIRFLKLFIYFS